MLSNPVLLNWSNDTCDYFTSELLCFPVIRFSDGINIDYMKRLVSQFKGMLSHYSKVFMIRADLKPQQYTQSNSTLSGFIKVLQARLKKELGLSKIAVIWCREKYKAEAQHYHMVVLVNGHKVNWPTRINRIMTELWALAGGAHHYIPKRCFYMLKRSRPNTYAPALYRASYLAKRWSKERGQGRAFGATCIEPNPKKCWLGG